MVILAAKSTDAHLEEAKRGFQPCEGGQGWWSFGRFWRLCLRGGFVSVVVKSCGAKCKSNLALMISVSGFHFSKGPPF